MSTIQHSNGLFTTKKGMLLSATCFFKPLVFMLLFILSNSFCSVKVYGQTIGTYQFSGADGCTANNVNSQPSNATFSSYGSVSTSCGFLHGYKFDRKDWNTGTSINTGEYNYFTITPAAGYSLNLTNLSFKQETSYNNSTTWIVRSSIDNYASNLATGTATTTIQTHSIDLPASFNNIGAVSFRFYIIDINSSLTYWMNDDVTVSGTVEIPCAATTPGTPTTNTPQCSIPGVTITAPGSAPSGQTWYWQGTNPSGTSTASNASSTYTATESGTFYIRSQHNSTSCWSESSATSAVLVYSSPNTPSVTVQNNCENSTLTSSASTGSYLWNTGETTQGISVVTAGTYSVTHTDGNNCTSLAGIGVAAPSGTPSTPIVTVQNDCDNSTLTSSITSGSYLWSTGETTQAINVTLAGTYSVTITENGCTSPAGTGTAAPKPTPGTPVITVQNNCDNSILTSSASAGSYLWSTGETTQAISVNTAGTYSVSVTENGCTSANGTGITAPTAPATPTVDVVNNCENSVLSSSPTTGTYLWNTGETTQAITVTGAGTYSVSITENGCTSEMGTATSTPDVMPTAVIVSGAGSFCNTTTITASGGTGGTIYWQNTVSGGTATTNTSNPQTINTSGTYYFRANNGTCWSTEGSALVTINNSPDITLGANPIVCEGIGLADLTYGATTNAPDLYNIDYDATAEAAGLVDESNVALPLSPIKLTASALAGTYNYLVSVSNSASSCSSATISKTLTIEAGMTVTSGPAISVLQSASPTPTALIGASIGGSASTGAWSVVSGGGTLSSIAQTISPQTVTYTPAANYSGEVVLRLTTNATICPAISENRIITVDPATTQTFYATSSYTVPACITSVTAECWGGGAGGGGNLLSEDGGGGGGGGAYSKSILTVTPGTILTVNVGQGGAGGGLGGDGTDGGDSWFINNTSILAKGGIKGLKQSGLFGHGGYGGLGGASTAGIGDLKFSGGNGGNGQNTILLGNGGGGGSSAGTSANGNNGENGGTSGGAAPTGGGAGGNSSLGYGSSGSVPGGGGAGSGAISQGGAGAGGKVIIRWTSSLAISSNAQAAATVLINTINQPIHSFVLNGANSCVTGFNFITTGDYAASEIGNFKLYYTTSNSFATTNLLATIASPSVAGTQTFPAFSLPSTGADVFMWICMDVASAAVNGHIITVGETTGSNLTSSMSATGLAAGSGTQTIIAEATITLTSAIGTGNQTICENDAITNITFAVGACGDGATVTGLPTGVTGLYSAGVVTISGIATVAGTFNYSVTATGSGGCISAIENGTITVNALPEILVNSATICAGVSTILTATGASSYLWSTSETTNPINVSPSVTTSFTVTGTLLGCSDSSVSMVKVNELPIVSSSVSPNNTVCIGTSVTLVGTGANTYVWTGGQTDTIAFIPTATETFTVTGTDANGCENTATQTITINELPIVNSTASPSDTLCSGSSVSLSGTGATIYVWTGGVTDNVSFVPASTETFTVSGTDANGCENTSTKTITVNDLPIITVSDPSPICAGGKATLTVGGADTYSWLPIAGLNVNTGATVTANPSSTETYTVTGVDGNGCESSNSINVIINSSCSTVCVEGN